MREMADMANPNVPRGLVPYRNIGGGPFNNSFNVYYVPATDANNIFVGDPVVVVTNSADANGIPTVTLATAGATNQITGVCVGLVDAGAPILPEFAITRDLPVYRQASTAAYIAVVDDPNALFMVQEDSVGGALPVGASGRNVNLVAGAGSTTYGTSGWQIQSSSIGTGATLQMRILRALQQVDNIVGANTKWLCKINLSTITNTLGV
jgi:hypothetical protein